MLKFLLVTLLLLQSVSANSQINVKTYIPPHAFEHKETIERELDNFFPNIPDYNYVPALIEHESCISLKHSRCWKSTSELKSAREQGVGLGQVTRAFREDGSVRFDTLTNLKNMYRNELKEASWDIIKNRPDLQIRMIVLLLKNDYKGLYAVKNDMPRLHFTDSAYNGGIRDVHRSRRACGLANNCDPQFWFENTERYIAKSPKVLYGNRSSIDINKYHVYDIFRVRLPKYQKYYFTEE